MARHVCYTVFILYFFLNVYLLLFLFSYFSLCTAAWNPKTLLLTSTHRMINAHALRLHFQNRRETICRPTGELSSNNIIETKFKGIFTGINFCESKQCYIIKYICGFTVAWFCNAIIFSIWWNNVWKTTFPSMSASFLYHILARCFVRIYFLIFLKQISIMILANPDIVWSKNFLYPALVFVSPPTFLRALEI